jgi:P-type Ca2+ transporter type 2C
MVKDSNPGSVSREGWSEKKPVPWYTLGVEGCISKLEVDPAKGLSASEASRRLQEYGPNELAEAKKESFLMAFLRQYRPLMQLVLVGTSIVAAAIQNWPSFVLVLLVTVFNALMGLRQESKASRSIEALREMMLSEARVRRDGEVIAVAARDLVPGDIVLLREGDRIPADGRLISAATLEVEESSLTGESTSAFKNLEPVASEDVAIGDRTNMVFMNTTVTRGRAEMVVTETGMSTQVGGIAGSLQGKKKESTPLTRQIDYLVKVILVLAAAAFITVMITGLSKDQSFNTIFLFGVSLIIGAIPAGLPAVVTTILSMGTVAMAGMNAIVKSLPATETLGSTSAICTDKTGTLTMNQMTVRRLLLPGMRYNVTGQGYGIEGDIQRVAGTGDSDLDSVLLPMVLCSDATIKEGKCIGDPNEGALVVLAAKRGIDAEETRAHYPRIATLPFDSEYMLMATFHEMIDEGGKKVVRCFVKGAPDKVIDRSAFIRQWDGEVLPMDEEGRARVIEANDTLAKEGLRELIVASRDLETDSIKTDGDLLAQVDGLVLMAMVGMADPPRPEVGEAISACKEAGIRVRMITGDHAVTAAAVAAELGIQGRAITGLEFEKMSDEEATRQIEEIGIIARVAPQDKVRLVEILQARGDVVAMTGDGVNDAPALKTADIGVAMGITGTDVSKEAAKMILTDDNFSTIVSAVKEGRVVYDNLMKFIRLQMSNLVAFILAFLGTSLIVGVTLFNPLQVLWIKFGEVVPVGAVLGYDTPSPGLMQRKPRPASQPVLGLRSTIQIAFSGFAIAAAVVAIFYGGMHHYDSETVGRTMAFVVFSCAPIVYALSLRFPDDSLFRRETLTNSKLWFSFLWGILSVFFITQIDLLRAIFDATPLTREQWGICLATVGVLILVTDLVKPLLRLIYNES